MICSSRATVLHRAGRCLVKGLVKHYGVDSWGAAKGVFKPGAHGNGCKKNMSIGLAWAGIFKDPELGAHVPLSEQF